jgi:phosphoribosyl-AMP cyclohydrolase
MRIMTQASFPTAPTKDALERGEVLSPRFDANGLIAAVATHAETGEVLMFAWMNAEALAKTLELGEAVYFSRSRNEIWHKGDTSGRVQKIVEIRIDCDQDCVWLKVLPQGDGGACHVGFRSCFYRVIEHAKLVERP